MFTQIRRFLLFQAFLFWQGGFLFYSAVVVPVGTDLLGSALEQGIITQKVTNWLNLIGIVWHLAFLWDLLQSPDSKRRRLLRWGCWATSAVILLALFVLHPVLDGLLVDETIPRANRLPFRRAHVAYLWLSTAHWIIGLATAWLTIQTWNVRTAALLPVGSGYNSDG
jgi:hypothetical protein